MSSDHAPPSHATCDVHDVEYLGHGATRLVARIYRPREARPCAALVDVHGGAWCHHDRLQNAALDAALASAGIVVCAVDFRMPPHAGYPASIADIHYAVRWLKARAASLGCDAQRVGLLGTSSGGHQAMLCAMRPSDARYASVKRGDEADRFDARVRFVVACWPVVEPLQRHRLAKHAYAHGDAIERELAELVVPAAERYWGDEAAMAEGSPLLALERNEPVERPPVCYVQADSDIAHPRPVALRFADRYRAAGGSIEQHWFEGIPRGQREFLVKHPQSPQALVALDRIVAFVRRAAGSG